MSTPFQKILNNFRKFSYSEKDKGTRFERLMQAYLQTDPKYSSRFKNVWAWDEFPAKKDFGGKDIGIDLVALTHSGDYWAIQCKCYQESAIIDKPAVDSFMATSSKTFLNDEMQTTKFAQRLWISTTNHWGTNAEIAIHNQVPPVNRINNHDLDSAPVNWEKLEKGLFGEASRTKRKIRKPHQETAIRDAHEYFKSNERGKLIMACGTGKTYTSLQIAETETEGKGLILFLVPSIALLGQTLSEWYADANEPINAICICSDSEVGRKKTANDDSDGFSVVDLALPASTDVKSILRQFEGIKANPNPGMTVVFSTYQSIEVIAQAQGELLKKGYTPFDLIICDEAHRTTGVTLSSEDSSAFVKVHDNAFLQAKKRLYMTATPRLFSDDTKSKAAQAEAVLCSMDDPKLYGEEIYRIGFGEAVEKDLLTDYKVLILTVSENDVPLSVQKMVSDENHEINSDDASKLAGCINALSKKIIGDAGVIRDSDPEPMRRALAFCQNIKVSEKHTRSFNTISEEFQKNHSESERNGMVNLESKHVDGSMSAPKREELLSWLKDTPDDSNTCKILTNVRCLSEGVDVPSLDAVLFLSARNSQVDVVQSVGRVMRKSEGKKYGYIIIPVVVPANIEPDKALDDNERYKVIWTVLNALRAHDDRFNATVNKIELNKKRPPQIFIGKPENYPPVEGGSMVNDQSKIDVENTIYAKQLSVQFEELQNVLFAKMVQKVGDRRYWELWAKDVAKIAEHQIDRITGLVKEEGEHKIAFAEFLKGLQKNINPSITEEEAIEMLSQHIITKPVFEALFEGYSFVKNNAISVSMQKMIELLEAQAIDKDTETLQKFYESVKQRAAGIDNAEGKQRIIIELYDKFFKTAFPKMVEKLGIVYTPVEVVDFIIHSVNDILQKEFGRSISEENIHILDPFTGTGTFITRLFQSGLIQEKDLERKYKHEIHANEIVLLAYYIAAVNIENAYHDATLDPDDGIGKVKYTPFDGICLTDTFQLGETPSSEKLFSEMFPQNSERVAQQKKAPLRVIIGNPPYSVGQKSANDNAQNQSYPKLDTEIANTYAKNSTAVNKNSLYDSYIKAFRWSTDRLDKDHGGIIAFVSNGAWIDGNSTDGFRKCLEKEFTSIYVINLRGNQRTSGELSRKEGGKIFGSGSRTPISITLLVRNPESKNNLASIFYHDIGDYLSREEKLSSLKTYKSINRENLKMVNIIPNCQGDWINHRDNLFESFNSLAPEKKFDQKTKSVFTLNSMGLGSSRDAWVYNYSSAELSCNIENTIGFYNQQVREFALAKKINPHLKVDDFIDRNPTKISWSSSLIPNVERGKLTYFTPSAIRKMSYRPFNKSFVYLGDKLIHRRGQFDEIFPTGLKNLIICISSTNKGLGLLITDSIADIHFNGDTQCFPLFYYEERKKEQQSLFDIDENDDSKYIRRDGISNFIYERAQRQYGKNVSKEDIFYYVYGFLHSPEYSKKFANDLQKMLPRLPLIEEVSDFWAFSKAGRILADLHLNYESVAPFEGLSVKGVETSFYKVEKIRFPKKGQKDKIIFNSKITIENIPAEAYEYIVNGKSAIEWIMERYQITTHKDSGIKNDPNDWAIEVNNPRYILDLLLSIINVSIQTVDIIKKLPSLNL